MLIHILLLFLLFLLLYTVIRAVYLYVLQVFLARIFNAKINYRSGHSFWSIRDIEVHNKEFKIRCKLFKPSFGVHTTMQVRSLEVENMTIQNIREIYEVAQNIHEKALPSRRFFHLSINIDFINFISEKYSFSMKAVKSIHSNSLFSFEYKDLIFHQNDVFNLTIKECNHTIHFLGKSPELVQILRPTIFLKCSPNRIIAESFKINAFSEIPAIWRATTNIKTADIEFLNVSEEFQTNIEDDFYIKFSDSLSISLVENMITFPSLHIENVSQQFKIKVKKVEVNSSFDKMKIDTITGNGHFKFLRLFVHLKWLKFSFLNVNKINLMIKMDNDEQCDVVLLNYIDDGKANISSEEMNIDVIAHRTSIASIHLSNFSSNAVEMKNDVNLVKIEKLNIVHSRGDVFKQFCSELFHKFHEKVTAKSHNFVIDITSLRIEEVMTNTFLLADNFELKFEVEKSADLDEMKRQLKNLYQKRIDVSKLKLCMRNNFSLKCSHIAKAEIFDYTKCDLSGTLVAFLGGNDIFGTCGIIHTIAESAFMAINKFEYPPLWFISFEIVSLELKLDEREFHFKQIKGETNSFTFETATLICPTARRKPAFNNHKYRNNNINNIQNDVNDENDDDDIITAIFDFWNDEYLFCSKISNSNQKNSNDNLFDLTYSKNNNSALKNSFLKRKNSRKMVRFSSQFEIEDKKHRPSQHYDDSFLIAKDKQQDKNVSLLISQEFNSDYETNNLLGFSHTKEFNSFDSIKRNISNNNNSKDNKINKINKINKKENDIAENNEIEKRIQKFVVYKGEYFENDGNTEVFVGSGTQGQHTLSNVAVKFKNHVPFVFLAEQIYGPKVKSFYVEYSITDRSLKSKSVVIDSSTPIAALFSRINSSFVHAEIGQILYGISKFEDISIDVIHGNLYPSNKNGFGKNKSNKGMTESILKCNQVSFKGEKFSVKMRDLIISISDSMKIEAKNIYLTVRIDFNFLDFFQYFHPQKTTIFAAKISTKIKPAMENAQATHKLSFKNTEMSIAFSDCISFKYEAFNLIFSEFLEPRKKTENNMNNDRHKRKKVNLFTITSSKNEQRDKNFKIASVYKNNTVISLNVDLNHVHFTGEANNIKAFNSTFEPIFQSDPNKTILNFFPIWTFKSISLFSFDLSIQFYDPSMNIFSNKTKYKIDVESKTINNFTTTLPRMLWDMLDREIRAIKGKISSMQEQPKPAPDYSTYIYGYHQ